MNAEEYAKKETERFTRLVHSLNNKTERDALEGMFALAYQTGRTAGVVAAADAVKQAFGDAVNGS